MLVTDCVSRAQVKETEESCVLIKAIHEGDNKRMQVETDLLLYREMLQADKKLKKCVDSYHNWTNSHRSSIKSRRGASSLRVGCMRTITLSFEII